MSEMAERVTEAIVSAIIDAGGTIDYRPQIVARAAIAAMREPTLAQAKAGMDSDDKRTGFETCAHIYRAMIDAALSPSPSPQERT